MRRLDTLTSPGMWPFLIAMFAEKDAVRLKRGLVRKMIMEMARLVIVHELCFTAWNKMP